MTIIRAFLLGFRDGKASPYDLSSGMTWDHPFTLPSRAYDRGATIGQWLGRRT